MTVNHNIQLSLALTDGNNQSVGYEQAALQGSDAKGFLQMFTVAANVSDQVVSLNTLASLTTFYLVSDQSVTVKINNSLVAVQAKRLLIDGGAITSLTISNPGSVTANVKILAAGS